MRRYAGFTLLETLAVLAILGFVIVALAQGMRFGAAAWGTRERAATGAEELETADRLLRRLIERAAPGSEQNPANFQGRPNAMALRSELPLAAGSDTARRIDAALGMDERHRLLLRWVPYRHARRMAPPVVGGSTVLVQGLDRVEIAYWGEPKPGTAAVWSDTWKGPAPPLLVRLRLIFPPDSRRSWPDIAAAPRDQAGFE